MWAQPAWRLRSHGYAAVAPRAWLNCKPREARCGWDRTRERERPALRQPRTVRERRAPAHTLFTVAPGLSVSQSDRADLRPRLARDAPGTLEMMADQDQAESDEPAPETTGGSRAGAAGWNLWVRRNFSMQRFLRPPPARPRSGSGSESDQSDLTAAQRSAAARTAVNNLNPRERQIGYIALAFELALTAAVVIPYLTHHVKLSKNNLKTMSAVHFFLVEGLVVAIFLLLGTLLKRRALLGFAALATAIWLIELPALRVFGLAYLGLGMWLLMKGLRSQQNVTRGSARRPPSQPRRSKRARAEAEALASRSAPKANKRYTPPKPTRRPPPKKPAPARAEPPK